HYELLGCVVSRPRTNRGEVEGGLRAALYFCSRVGSPPASYSSRPHHRLRTFCFHWSRVSRPDIDPDRPECFSQHSLECSVDGEIVAVSECLELEPALPIYIEGHLDLLGAHGTQYIRPG